MPNEFFNGSEAQGVSSVAAADEDTTFEVFSFPSASGTASDQTVPGEPDLFDEDDDDEDVDPSPVLVRLKAKAVRTAETLKRGAGRKKEPQKRRRNFSSVSLSEKREAADRKEFLSLLRRRYSLRGVCNKLLRPAQLVRQNSPVLNVGALALTAFFFGCFYLTVAMDWRHAGLISTGRMWAFLPVGLLTGVTAALALCAMLSGLSRFVEKEPQPPFRFTLSVAVAAVLPTGLAAAALLIGWIFSTPVSMSLGVTALLWWLYQILELMRNLFRKKYLPVLTALTCYGFVLFCWLTFTFRLK